MVHKPLPLEATGCPARLVRIQPQKRPVKDKNSSILQSGNTLPPEIYEKSLCISLSPKGEFSLLCKEGLRENYS